MREIEVGLRVREAREAAGLSKSGLARAVGVSHTAVDNWERGEVEIKAGNLLAIERATKYSFRWIMTGRGPKEAGSFVELSDAVQKAVEKLSQMDQVRQEYFARQIVEYALLESPK